MSDIVKGTSFVKKKKRKKTRVMENKENKQRMRNRLSKVCQTGGG